MQRPFGAFLNGEASMAVKTTGVEWKRFYNDQEYWPKGRYHDEEVIYIDGVMPEEVDLDNIPDAAVMKIEGGYVADDTVGQIKDTTINSLEGHFKKWRKKQSTESIVIEVDKSKVEELKAALKSLGAKIVK
jgi:hypothetical protein